MTSLAGFCRLCTRLPVAPGLDGGMKVDMHAVLQPVVVITKAPLFTRQGLAQHRIGIGQWPLGAGPDSPPRTAEGLTVAEDGSRRALCIRLPAAFPSRKGADGCRRMPLLPANIRPSAKDSPYSARPTQNCAPHHPEKRSDPNIPARRYFPTMRPRPPAPRIKSLNMNRSSLFWLRCAPITQPESPLLCGAAEHCLPLTTAPGARWQ